MRASRSVGVLMAVLVSCGDPPVASAPVLVDEGQGLAVLLPGPTPSVLPGLDWSSQDIPVSVNDAGVIVGESNGRAVAWVGGVPTALPNVGESGVPRRAWDVNASGQIVGEFSAGSVQGAALWSPDGQGGYTAVDLGARAAVGAYMATATAINGFGQVAGTYRVYTNEAQTAWTDRCFLWTPARQNANVGTLANIGTLGGDWCVANDVNAAGVVVGASWDATGTTYAFIWRPSRRNATTGTISRLLTGEFSSYASGINDVGQVTGSRVPMSGPELGFLWTPSGKGGSAPTLADLALPSSDWAGTRGMDLDASGNIAGYAYKWIGTDYFERGFFWQNGSYIELPGDVAGPTSTTAMNGTGVVVGARSDGAQRIALRWAVTLSSK